MKRINGSSTAMCCILLLAVMTALLLGGCADRKVSQKTILLSPDLQQVLVLAFRDMNADTGEQINVRCPLSGKVFVSGQVDPSASPFLTKAVMSSLRNKNDRDFRLVSVEEVQDIQSTMERRGQIASERALVMEAGRLMEADAVLVGHIYRYIERIGRNLSVESPASVAFDLHLVRMSDGHVLWTGYFDETQKTLMEDMFDIGAFLQRDGKWVTAEQMAATGLEKIMETFKTP